MKSLHISKPTLHILGATSLVAALVLLAHFNAFSNPNASAQNGEGPSGISNTNGGDKGFGVPNGSNGGFSGFGGGGSMIGGAPNGNGFQKDGAGQPPPFGGKDGQQGMMPGGSQFKDKQGMGFPGGFSDQGKGQGDMRGFGNGENGRGPQGDMEQQQKMMEQQQKMRDEQRFQQMKQGGKQFANGATQMKKMVAKMKTKLLKCNVGIPSELTDALNESDTLIAKLGAAQNADEMDDVMSSLQDAGGAMQEWGPKIGDLDRLCQMLSRADKDLKNIQRDETRLEKQAASNKKMNLTDLITPLKEAYGTMKQALADAKTLAATDPETALSKLEDDLYGQMDDFQSQRQAVEMALNMSKGIKNAKNEITQVNRHIKSLKNKKQDTSELEALVATATQKINELQSLKSLSADDLLDRLQELADVKQDIMERLSDAGVDNFVPQLKGTQGYNFALPPGFEKSPQEGNGGQGE